MPAKNRPLSVKKREALRDAFTAHLRQTNNPESFPEISLTKTDQDADFDLLRQFSVDKSTGKHSKVRCSFCSPKAGKWIHNGWVAYFPEDQKLRFIGPDCGASHLTKFNAIREARAKEIEDDRRRDFVNDNAPSIAALLDRLPALIKAAEDLETFQRILKNKAGQIFAELKQSATHGELRKVVHEEVVSLKGSTVKRDLLRREVKFSDFHGAGFFKADLGIALRLKNAQRTLQRWTPAAAIKAINANDESAFAFATHWTDAFKKTRKQTEAMRDLVVFFAPNSLRLLTEWSTELHSSNRFSASLKSDVFRLRDEYADTQLVSFTLPPSFAGLDQPLPELLRKTG